MSVENPVSLQGNRISFDLEATLLPTQINPKDFQLINLKSKEIHSPIDKIENRDGKLVFFPKEKLLAKDGAFFAINYIGVDSYLKNEFSNKVFKNTSQARLMSLNELKLIDEDTFTNNLTDKENDLEHILIRDKPGAGGILNYIDLQEDNTIYYTTNINFAKNEFNDNNEKNDTFKIDTIEKIEGQQASNINKAMQYIRHKFCLYR